MTPMARELRRAREDQGRPESAASEPSLPVRRLREGVEHWQSPAPDGAILLPSAEMTHAIESFASETTLDTQYVAHAGDGATAADELFLHEVAHDVGVIAAPPPLPARWLNTRVLTLGAAASLLGAVLGAGAAFRTAPRPATVVIRQATEPAVGTVSVDLLTSARAHSFVPLHSGVAPRRLETGARESIDRVLADPRPVSHPSNVDAVKPASAVATVQSRRAEVLTEPAVIPTRVPATAAEPATSIVPANDAPAPASRVAALTAAPESTGDARTSLPRATEAPRVEAVANTAIAAVLDRYRTAFNDLDAQGARTVWPGADIKSLDRAFGALKEQQLSFDDCAITLHGDSAIADCRGTATYVPKVGRKAPRVEARHWRFQVEKRATGWLIQSVAAR